MSRTSKFFAKTFVKSTAVTYVIGKAVVTRGAGFVNSLIKDVRDEINKEEQAKDEPVQLDLPLEDSNEIAEKA